MLVTTKYEPAPEMQLYAQYIANQFGWRYVERKNDTLAQLRKRYEMTESMMVLTNEGWRWYLADDSPAVFFHPSMSHVRVKRCIRGEQDPMIKIAEISEGDSVLDCTAGMCSDAIVFSHAVGDTGKVDAIESTTALFFLVREGLKHYQTDIEPLRLAMNRIRIINDDHFTFLQTLPDKCYDVVYFDPMFRTPPSEVSAISSLRNSLNQQSLDMLTIEQALRVARKVVLMKETTGSPEFDRLGFTVSRRNSGNITFGVIRP
jgi:16S rRNA (guanine1516-N2)-methyltransferase